MNSPQKDNVPKVLVCDDEKLFTDLLTTVLASYKVTTARSGKEALEKLHTFSPDLVLLDVGMGEMNGYEVCEAIRAHPKFRFVKVVFLSGNVTLEDRMRGYRAGGDDYITKPFNSEELLAKIRCSCGLRRWRKSTRSSAAFWH